MRRQKLDVVDAAVLLFFEAEDIASPTTYAPFSKVAVNRTSVVVTGMTVPLMASTCPMLRTASSNEPVTPLSAASRRLPKHCPRSVPLSKR